MKKKNMEYNVICGIYGGMEKFPIVLFVYNVFIFMLSQVIPFNRHFFAAWNTKHLLCIFHQSNEYT